MPRALTAAVIALIALNVAGCDVVHDQRLDGPYRLHAVDTMDAMALLWEAPDGSLIGDGLPGPTVVALGIDERHIVAKVHPQHCQPFARDCRKFGPDRSRTEYWVVIRQPDEATRLPYRGIRGPMTAGQFAVAQARHSLPAFSINFAGPG